MFHFNDIYDILSKKFTDEKSCRLHDYFVTVYGDKYKMMKLDNIDENHMTIINTILESRIFRTSFGLFTEEFIQSYDNIADNFYNNEDIKKALKNNYNLTVTPTLCFTCSYDKQLDKINIYNGLILNGVFEKSERFPRSFIEAVFMSMNVNAVIYNQNPKHIQTMINSKYKNYDFNKGLNMFTSCFNNNSNGLFNIRIYTHFMDIFYGDNLNKISTITDLKFKPYVNKEILQRCSYISYMISQAYSLNCHVYRYVNFSGITIAAPADLCKSLDSNNKIYNKKYDENDYKKLVNKLEKNLEQFYNENKKLSEELTKNNEKYTRNLESEHNELNKTKKSLDELIEKYKKLEQNFKNQETKVKQYNELKIKYDKSRAENKSLDQQLKVFSPENLQKLENKNKEIENKNKEIENKNKEIENKYQAEILKLENKNKEIENKYQAEILKLENQNKELRRDLNTQKKYNDLATKKITEQKQYINLLLTPDDLNF